MTASQIVFKIPLPASGVTGGGAGVRTAYPGKLYVKIGRTQDSLYISVFGILLVFSRLLLFCVLRSVFLWYWVLVWTSTSGFTIFLNSFSECWLAGPLQLSFFTLAQIFIYATASNYKLQFFNHFLSHHLALIFRIHHSCNRVKWSNTLKIETARKHFLLGKFNTLDYDDPLLFFHHNFSWYDGIAYLSPNTGFR